MHLSEKILKLDQILNDWDKDTEIDITELGEEARKISKYHSKYLRFRATENLKLIHLQGQFKELKKAKHEFYTMGPTKETHAKGWELPASGRVIKSDLPIYMDSDRDVIEMNLKVAYQAEVVYTLDQILLALKNRNWEIGRMIDDIKLKMGA